MLRYLRERIANIFLINPKLRVIKLNIDILLLSSIDRYVTYQCFKKILKMSTLR